MFNTKRPRYIKFILWLKKKTLEQSQNLNNTKIAIVYEPKGHSLDTVK